MADNTTLNSGTGGDVIATDDIGGIKFQRVKLVLGADGVNDGDVSSSNALPVADNGGSLTTDTPQLPAALVGGRLDTNNGAWLGSTAPTVGQKTMANSIPIAIASDQSTLTISGTVTANAGTGFPSVQTEDAASAGGETGLLFLGVRNDAAAARTNTDGDFGAIALDAAGRVGISDLGGSVSVDDNGSSLTVDTTQLPAALVGGRLDINNGAWLGSTAPTVGQKTMANSLPVVLASDQSAVPVSGTVTANAGTGFPSVQTEDTASGGGESGLMILGVRNDAATARTSTDGDFGAIALDSAGRVGVTDLGGSLSVDDNGGSITTDTPQLPAALVGGRLDANTGAWLGSTAPTVGQKAMASSIPVVISSDQSSVPISGTVTANAGTGFPSVQSEDAAAAGGESGLMMLGVRNDAAAARTSTDGDFGAIALDAAGRVGVSDLGGSITIDATSLPLPTGAATLAEQQTQTTALQLLDDTVHATNGALNKATAIAGQLDDTGTTAATEDNVAAVRITAQRALHANLRTAAGTEIGTAGSPVRTDPTGSTTQPVSGTVTANAGTGFPSVQAEDAAAAGGETGLMMLGVRNDAAAARTSTDGDFGALALDSAGRVGVTDLGGSLSVDDNGGSLTTDTTQLPSALVGGRLDINNGAWLGSTAPTVGQKTMANSLPVAIASDQGALAVSGTVTANAGTGFPSVQTEDAASAGAETGLMILGVRNDAAASRTSTDGDFGAIALDAAGRVGVTDLGGALSVDDNGGSLTVDSTQLPAALVGGRLDVNNGAWLGSTAPTVGQKTMANSVPVVISSDQSTLAISAASLPLPTGASTLAEQQTQTTALQLIDDAVHAPNAALNKMAALGAQMDDASTVVATEGNVSALRINTNRALHTILRNGSDAEAGTAGAPLRVDPTGSTTQPVSGTITANAGTGFPSVQTEDAASGGGETGLLLLGVRNDAAAARTSTDGDFSAFATDAAGRVGISDLGGSITIDTTQLPAALVGGRLDINNGAWLGSTAPTVGQKTMANSLPVAIASDQGALAVSGTVTANAGTGFPTVQAEDAAAAGGDSGLLIFGVRNDSGAARTSTDGDFGAIALDSGGRVGITTLGGTISVSDGGGTITVDDGTGSLTVDAPVGTPVNVQIGDGTRTATVRDTGTSDSLNVAIVDASGNQITSFGGGTQYTEDAAAAADPVGNMMMAVRLDALVGITSTDGDNIAVRATNKGEIYVKQSDVVSVNDNGGSLTTDSPQLPAALVGGRLDANVGAWLGSTAPSVGQKTMANSLPVALASDQTALPVTDNGASLTVDDGGASLTVDLASEGTSGGGAPSSTISIGARIGANLTALEATTADPGDSTTGLVVRTLGALTDNGGFTDGTSKVTAAGFILDEVAGTALAENDIGAARIDSKRAQVFTLEDSSTRGLRASVTVGQALKVDNSAVVQPVSDNGSSLTVDDGGATISVDDGGASLTVDGTVTANAGSGFPSVQTEDTAAAGGETGLMMLGVRNDAAASRTSTDGDFGAIALDAAGRVGIADLGGSISVDDNGSSLTVDSTQLPAALVGGRLDTNNGAWLGSTAPTVGQKTMANSIPVAIASDQSTLTISGTVTANAGTGHPSVQTEDAASAGGETGLMMLGVRNDAAAARTSTDGDFGAIALDSAGRVGISDLGGSITIDAASLPLPTGAATLTEQQTQTTALQLIDDAVHATNGALNKTMAIGGQFDDVATTAATENNVAPVRITSQRGVHVNIRDASGTEISPATEGTVSTISNDVGVMTAAFQALDSPFSRAVAIAGHFDDAATLTVAENNVAHVRITGARGLHSNLRDASGSEIGTAGAPIRTDPTGSTTQPVSGTVTANAGTGFPSVQTEDAAAAGGETGIMLLGVRNDSGVTRTSTNGDFGAISLDSVGRVAVTTLGGSLSVTGSVTTTPGSGWPDQFVEDDPSAGGEKSWAFLGVRNDAGAARTSTDGDYGTFAIDAAGRVGISTLGGTLLVQHDPYTAIAHAQVTVTTAGTRVQFASSACKSIAVRALPTNAGNVFIGGAAVSSANGFVLAPGDGITLDINNANLLYVDSASNGDKVSWIVVS